MVQVKVKVSRKEKEVDWTIMSEYPVVFSLLLFSSNIKFYLEIVSVIFSIRTFKSVGLTSQALPSNKLYFFVAGFNSEII